MIQQQCTGLASVAFNSKYVVPSFLRPWNYETGNVTFSNESASAASNGTKVPNIDNPCWRDSPKQELYCQFNSQTSLLGMQLAILFTTWQGLSLFIELIIPWLARVAHRRKEAKLLREQGLSRWRPDRKTHIGDIARLASFLSKNSPPQQMCRVYWSNDK